MRAALRPWGQAAVGLASALAASGAVAQEPTSPAADPATQPAAQVQGTENPGTPQAQSPGAPAATSQAPGTEEAGQGAQDTFVLPTVQVEAEAEKGYQAKESSLTRLPKPLVDTPQSVTVVPEEVLEEQQVTTVREALRNVSGITISAGEAGRQGDTFILRGFSAQNDISRDGARDLGWYSRDTFNLEGVEAYFGPSAVLFGRGSTGGAVNLVTKKPKKTSFQDVSISGGTAPSGRLEADLNQAVSDALQVRLNVMGELGGAAARDVVEDNRLGFAPSLRLQTGENTTFEFDYLFQREDGVPDYGEPYFNRFPVSTSLDVPRESFYGVADSDQTRVDAHVASGRLLQRFGEAVLFTNTLRYGRVDRFLRPTSPRGLAPTTGIPETIGRQRFEIETDGTYLSNLADVRGTFDTGFLKHTTNAGVELSWEKRAQGRMNLSAVGLPTGPNIPADLFNPDPRPDLSAVTPTFQSANTSLQRTLGLYAADQIAIGKYVEVLGSIRWDVFNTDYTAVAAAGTKTRLESSDKLFNWRAGVVVHPMENTSVYGMYGTSANPSAELATLSADTVSLDPEKNAIVEVGAKGEFIEGRLGLTAAVFRITKTDARVPNTDPEGPPQILAGEQRVQGYNVGVAGTVTRDWKMLANYTLMDSAITEHTNPYLVGQRLPNTPRHSLSLWTTYQVLENLSVGGGAVYQDVTSVSNPTSAATATNNVPNFWRFDAFASYEWGKANLQLNVYNLTDALYYDQFYAGHAVPAEGVSALLTARYRF
ncbi:TonB-dependent receptor [Pyxidicoccus xibeiensis]|uniref:TonB-dependent receptor n=1 Tax=Pyxidicoccus xibeiensis TaxID=2906759 RepID=UPI0020A7AF9E|nr:TonB-dependent siderophore receptor [Pyxidicoccus xibeiensis]MCP3138129.1 TonB-dependent siderophore receptor [Pyxidicoccus xibeiensis]